MTAVAQADWTTDVLVVGSGAGALTAALVAAELGVEPLVIEKGHLWGGTSATSGGTLWIPCSRHMREAGFEDTPDEAFAYIKALTGDEVPDSRIRAYIANAGKMLDFLEAHGGPVFQCVNYADYHMGLAGAKQNRSHETQPMTAGQLGGDYDALQPIHPGAQAFGRVNWTISEARPIMTRGPGWWWSILKVMARYWLDFPQRLRTPKDRRLTAGNALLGQLRRGLNAKGVPVKLGVAFQELIVEGGRVVGAAVEVAGERRTIRARRGVVLGAGGFEHNAGLRQDGFQTRTSPNWSGSQRNNTGDAIQAAQRAGAALDLMDAAWWAPAFRLGDEDRARPMFAERALPGCIIVNQLGRRYMNESASYHAAGGEMIRLNSPECPTAPSWFIFDGWYRSRYAVGPMLPGPPSRDGAVKPSLWEVLRKGETLAELAAAIEVDADVLATTVARFNEHAAQGEDPDFERGVNGYDRYYGDPRHTPNPCLKPLEQAPYYALKIFPGDIGTKGGVVTDEHGRALAGDGEPIAGLYAIGNSSASVMGRAYPGAGATLGPAMTFGYLAAHHLAQMDAAR